MVEERRAIDERKREKARGRDTKGVRCKSREKLFRRTGREKEEGRR